MLSIGLAAGLTAACLAVLRAAAIPEMLPAGLASSLWWLPPVARVLAGGVVALFGVGLAWRGQQRSAAVLLAAGTGISILGSQWQASSPVQLLAFNPAAGWHAYASAPQAPGWSTLAMYWPFQLLLCVVAVVCLTVSTVAPIGRRSGGSSS
ncbi:MAG: hypothetical protein ACREOA_07325 [Candidatus Dormibacteria bacterium]